MFLGGGDFEWGFPLVSSFLRFILQTLSDALDDRFRIKLVLILFFLDTGRIRIEHLYIGQKLDFPG